ncbi:MAG: glycoside hydrolase family 88 protein [Treponema sp.]|jgi:rhamnogalacturonyl hydrolase YesR|nr:glycoside hydrolase family 88 protein [Treponema sp.]
MTPDTEIVKKVKNALMSIQRRSWEQGEAMQAMLELRDYDTLLTMAREVSYIRLEDGRTTLTTAWEKNTVTDTCACGEALMAAAKISNDQLIRDTYERLIDYTLNKAERNDNGILYHIKDSPQFWVDSIYMMPPFLAAAGYCREAVKQINGYWDIFYDPQSKMLNWIWDDGEKKFFRTNHRGICTGYAAAGIVKTALNLPQSMKREKDDFMEKTKVVIDGILKFIDDYGVCHDTLDDPNSIIGINAVSMVVYSIYRALAAGYLTEEYRKTADHLRLCQHGKVDPYGFLYGVCGVPNNDQTGISANGQSFFLLMEAAHYDYMENPVNNPDAWYNSISRQNNVQKSSYISVISQ